MFQLLVTTIGILFTDSGLCSVIRWLLTDVVFVLMHICLLSEVMF